MATASKISVINQALLAIGSQAQVSSLNEGSAQANAAGTLFTPRFEALARAAPWNCLRAQAALTLVAAAAGTPENPDGTTLPLPPTPWLYSYQQPPLCLQVRFLLPSLPSAAGTTPLFSVNTGAPTWMPNRGNIPFAVGYAVDASNNPINVILTNLSQAEAVYTINQPNPQLWDSSFEQAMVATLAAWFVPALSMHLPLMNAQIKIAEGLVDQARTRDGNEGTTSMDHTPDWMRARQGATGVYLNNGYSAYGYSWPNLIWPQS